MARRAGRRAALYGVLLTCAYGISGVGGRPRYAYLRAIGRPGLEARYGAVSDPANVVLTIALGVAFGPVGGVVSRRCRLRRGHGWFFAPPARRRAAAGRTGAARARRAWSPPPVPPAPPPRLGHARGRRAAALGRPRGDRRRGGGRVRRLRRRGHRRAASVGGLRALLVPTARRGSRGARRRRHPELERSRAAGRRAAHACRADSFRDFRTLVVDNGPATARWRGWLAIAKVEVLVLERTTSASRPAVDRGAATGEEEYVALLTTTWSSTRVAGDPGRRPGRRPRGGGTPPLKQRLRGERPRAGRRAGDAIAWTGRGGPAQGSARARPRPVRPRRARLQRVRRRRADRRAARDRGPVRRVLFATVEDRRLGFRRQLAGRPRATSPRPSSHRRRRHGRRTPPASATSSPRPRSAFVLKNFPAPWLVRFAPLIAAELARTLLVAARRAPGPRGRARLA